LFSESKKKRPNKLILDQSPRAAINVRRDYFNGTEAITTRSRIVNVELMSRIHRPEVSGTSTFSKRPQA
jgi:hypothetical protein